MVDFNFQKSAFFPLPKFNIEPEVRMVSKFGISPIPGVDFQVNHVKLQGCKTFRLFVWQTLAWPSGWSSVRESQLCREKSQLILLMEDIQRSPGYHMTCH